MFNKNFNYIIFSSINWSTHNQLHHELTNFLISQGNKVLFVENTGSRSLKISDYKRVVHRIKTWFTTTLGVKPRSKNFTIFSPLFIPLPFNYLAIKINNFILSRTINKWQDLIEKNETIIITFLPTPLIYQLSKKINKALFIYYCADEMTHFSNYKNKIIKWEKIIINNSNIVFYTSAQLGKKITKFSNNSFLVQNGVDFKKFNLEKKDDKFINFKEKFIKIIGYIGALRNIVDHELLYKIAYNYPNYALVLIGPTYPDFKSNENYKKLKSLNNVFFLGSVEHSDIPKYTSNFNIAIIPYIVNDFTNSIYPVKLNEYLSQGLNIISTNILEISNFKINHPNLISVAKDENDFISLIHKNLNNNFYNEKINYAATNDWKNKFSFIDSIIQKEYVNINNKIVFEDKFKNYLKNLYSKVLCFSFVILFLFFIIFKSPLFWLLGNNLVVRDSLKETDTLIAFVGNGETQYNNFSFQKRALDILKYYNESTTKNIILISGRKKEIADVDLIKSYLVSKGIPELKFIIPRKNPVSTYDGVLLAYDKLVISNLYISILTAPYHSKRLKLIWKKNYKDLQIFFPEVADTPKNKIKWGLKIDDMKIIIYEYSSIIYNWYKGRL